MTGIPMLSIGTTKNEKGGILKRYCVNHKIEGKPVCKSFYFGANTGQKEAFSKSIEYMIEKRLYSSSGQAAEGVYRRFKHPGLLG